MVTADDKRIHLESNGEYCAIRLDVMMIRRYNEMFNELQLTIPLWIDDKTIKVKLFQSIWNDISYAHTHTHIRMRIVKLIISMMTILFSFLFDILDYVSLLFQSCIPKNHANTSKAWLLNVNFVHIQSRHTTFAEWNQERKNTFHDDCTSTPLHLINHIIGVSLLLHFLPRYPPHHRRPALNRIDHEWSAGFDRSHKRQRATWIRQHHMLLFAV